MKKEISKVGMLVLVIFGASMVMTLLDEIFHPNHEWTMALAFLTGWWTREIWNWYEKKTFETDAE